LCSYLRENGLFGAKAMFLVVSSHDAHNNINHQPVVGGNPAKFIKKREIKSN
jgi:acetyltransferase-like isoleucine patch superfamily enzyme